MNKLIVANWKSNPATESEAIALAQACDFKNVVIAPPFLFINSVKKVLKYAKLGAQDVFWEKGGAYTGQISTEELKSAEVSYVIIGHSERRKNVAETDEMINKKVLAALSAGLRVILCVGEPRSVRDKGIDAAKNYVEQQLDKDLIGIKNANDKLIIAYEPVWAIGTGIPDKLEDTVKMISFIKTFLAKTYQIKAISCLYGGSVNAGNAKQILGAKEINGALVGGASIKSEEFRKIVEYRL